MSPESKAFHRLGARAKVNIDDAIASTLAIHPAHDGAEGDTLALLVSSDAALSTTRRTLGAVIAELDGQSDLPPSLEQLADATFVARLSASQLGAELERARVSEEHWQVVRAASKVRRGLLRALRTLDCLVCGALGVTAFTSYHDAELKEALEARRTFNRLREDSLLVRGRTTTPALRAAGMSLAKLTCRGRWLRIYDQQLAAELRTRIAEWLKQRGGLRKSGGRSAATDSHLLEGKRLLGDYFNFVEITHEVNKRPELIEHDGEQLRALLGVWDQLGDEEIASALETVRGRSFELDELLLLAAPRDAIRAEVEAVAERLAGRSGEQASGSFPTTAPSLGDRSSVTSISQVFARFA